LDMDELQGLFKKYSPLIICLIGVLFLVATGDYRRALLLAAVGFGMQYFWIRLRYR